MTCDLLAFPSEFKAGLDLLPLNFKLGLGEKRGGQGIYAITQRVESTDFFMITSAPKTRVSTSSVIIASMTPDRLRWASSASASPSAYPVAK